MMVDDRTDVAVVGAGIAGRLMALALAQAPGLALECALLDAAPGSRPSGDIRAFAIAPGTRRMLASLGVWQRVAAAAQPVSAMDITDSRLEEIVRPVLLSFEGQAEPGEPLLHFIDARELARGVGEVTQDAGLRIVWGCEVTGLEKASHALRLKWTGGDVAVRLVIGADGARSAIRRAAALPSVGWPYRQSAIVAIIAHELGHDGRAVQHFLPQGPFAMLPLPGRRSGLVWTVSSGEAKRLMGLGRDDFVGEMQRAAGPERGRVELVEGPFEQELELGLARRLVAPRVALVGDAAHRVHPLAGQGLNIGLRDVATLAEVLADASRRGEDIGSLAVLERYQRWRRFDIVQFAAATDLLNRLFSNDSGPLRLVRDIGLGLVQRAGTLKGRFVGEAAGQAGELPRLFRGEPA